MRPVTATTRHPKNSQDWRVVAVASTQDGYAPADADSIKLQGSSRTARGRAKPRRDVQLSGLENQGAPISSCTPVR